MISIISKILFALSLLALCACSTYFNTFYNAENAFDEAYEQHQRVMRNYPDSIVMQPPEEARAHYERAVEKATKVLEVFPKDKKWHDDAIFLMAKAHLYQKEFGKCIRRIRQLQQEHPQSPFIPESHLYLAMAYIADDQLVKGEETLKFTLDRYPHLDNDQKLSLLLVEIQIRQEGRSQAIERLERARATVRDPRKKMDLLLRVSELYLDLRRPEKALKLLRSAPRDKRDSHQEYRIDRNLVNCLVAMDSLDQALDLLSDLLKNRRHASHEKEILYQRGMVLERQGNIEEAIAAFRRLLGPADSSAFDADTSSYVSKAWYALGRLHQKHKEDYEEALRYYTLVAEGMGVDSAVTEAARGRMDAMQQLVELREGIESLDSASERLEQRYLIGELFLYELDEADSASNEFLRIARDSIADTGITPKALCAAAVIARDDLLDTLLADSLCREVIERFPASDYACRAQRELRVAVPTKTMSQKSLDAFRDAEKRYLKGDDTKEAVQAFFNVYKSFPELAIAPKSLFVAAWIADNDLQKKKTAKSLYEKICERYPESEYCTKEARPRIKVVLDTLEALRRLRQEGGGGSAKKEKNDAGVSSPSLIDEDGVDATAVTREVGEEFEDVEEDYSDSEAALPDDEEEE